MFCIFLDLAEKKYFFKLFYSVLALKMIRFSYLEIIFIYPPHFLITELFSDYANDCLKLMGSMGARTFNQVFLGSSSKVSVYLLHASLGSLFEIAWIILLS